MMRPFRDYETSYAGVGVTFCRVPLVLDPAELAGADVVIVGAPFDEGVSYRPGTRFGPRAVRMAEDVGAPNERPSMELGIDPFETLKVVDNGDVEVASADLARSHASLLAHVSHVLALGG